MICDINLNSNRASLLRLVLGIPQQELWKCFLKSGIICLVLTVEMVIINPAFDCKTYKKIRFFFKSNNLNKYD